ncbi:MAG TPA: AzlD domain-containing protein, partial [Ktedonobacterales bacterium]|nr:AzlD domain-containing protein [Ktedonobacterales bacterium]
MHVDTPALVAIIGMALVTYLTRMSGLWLMGRVTLTPRVEAGLRAVPGAVIISILAPAALTAGPAEIGAALATVLLMLRTRNLLVAIVAGVVVVWALR